MAKKTTPKGRKKTVGAKRRAALPKKTTVTAYDSAKAMALLDEILRNPRFKEEFMASPRRILIERGFRIPNSIREIKVLQETADTMYLVIPFRRTRVRGRRNIDKLWEALLFRRPTT
jgi:hypothetical protein